MMAAKERDVRSRNSQHLFMDCRLYPDVSCSPRAVMSRLGLCHSEYCTSERNSSGCVRSCRTICAFCILGEVRDPKVHSLAATTPHYIVGHAAGRRQAAG